MTRPTESATQFESLLILGGGGLVGTQVAKRAATDLRPKRIIVATLYRQEALDTIADLKSEFDEVEFVGYYGNIFLRGRPIPVEEEVDLPSPNQQKSDPEVRKGLFSDIYHDFDQAYRESFLVRLIHETEPAAIVDCVNTATGISYQDVFLASDIVSRGLNELREFVGDAGASARSGGEAIEFPADRFHAFGSDLENLLISISIPELILHARLLYRAMTEKRTHVYVKVGTTGTGGMGLNIPYTHGEDKPSPTLMTKTAIAFAQTGLLFLMARTANGPIVKEVKPAAMIGYRDIEFSAVRGNQWKKKDGRLVVERDAYVLYETREQSLDGTFDTMPQPDEFEELTNDNGSKKTLQLAAVNTGENGMFTRGEFEAITHTGQMEFITPEEIAHDIVLELRGSNTGHDVIGAIDSTIMNPTYKAGMIRHVAIEELEKLEAETSTPSIALGQLGPPQLAKYLYESHLFHIEFQTLSRLLGENDESAPSGKDLSALFFERLKSDPLRETITSIGIPILHPNGEKIWRGPSIKIPAFNPKNHKLELTAESVDLYATKGWVDLRPSHMEWWIQMFREMRQSTEGPGSKRSSERLTRAAYLKDEIRIGEVVAWIFNNRIDPAGHRIK